MAPCRISLTHKYGLPKNSTRTQGGQVSNPLGQGRLRRNLIKKLQAGEKLFPGIVGYDETVIPQTRQRGPSRHNIILLGLRGQAKSRIIRMLTDLLDERIPIIAAPKSTTILFDQSLLTRQALQHHGDLTPLDWIDRDARFVEKLATPDVTVPTSSATSIRSSRKAVIC